MTKAHAAATVKISVTTTGGHGHLRRQLQVRGRRPPSPRSPRPRHHPGGTTVTITGTAHRSHRGQVRHNNGHNLQGHKRHHHHGQDQGPRRRHSQDHGHHPRRDGTPRPAYKFIPAPTDHELHPRHRLNADRRDPRPSTAPTSQTPRRSSSGQQQRSYTVDTATEITAVTKAMKGTVSVSVTTASGTANAPDRLSNSEPRPQRPAARSNFGPTTNCTDRSSPTTPSTWTHPRSPAISDRWRPTTRRALPSPTTRPSTTLHRPHDCIPSASTAATNTTDTADKDNVARRQSRKATASWRHSQQWIRLRHTAVCTTGRPPSSSTRRTRWRCGALTRRQHRSASQPASGQQARSPQQGADRSTCPTASTRQRAMG